MSKLLNSTEKSELDAPTKYLKENSNTNSALSALKKNMDNDLSSNLLDKQQNTISNLNNNIDDKKQRLLRQEEEINQKKKNCYDKKSNVKHSRTKKSI